MLIVAFVLVSPPDATGADELGAGAEAEAVAGATVGATGAALVDGAADEGEVAGGAGAAAVFELDPHAARVRPPINVAAASLMEFFTSTSMFFCALGRWLLAWRPAEDGNRSKMSEARKMH